MYEDMKEFLQEEFIRDAEEELREVQNDPKLKDRKAPDSIKERLFAEIDAREEASRRTLTEEEEKLIEIGRLYVRRQKRHKYFVLAAVLVLAFAFGVTAMGGPKKLVEDIRRKVMGRTQIGVDVDTEELEQIEIVDEEVGYQTVKDEWGVEPVRMQYYPERTYLSKFEFNEIMKTAQFVYDKGEDIKIIYQIIPNKETSSQSVDMEDKPLQELEINVQGQQLKIEEYLVENQNKSRWVVCFSYQELNYIIWIMDESQSNMEKIVKNLKFF